MTKTTKQKIIEILSWYDLNDFEIDEITTAKDIIEYLEDSIYDYGDETCSYDVTILENMSNAINELKELEV